MGQMKAGFVAAPLPSAATIASVVSQTKPRVHGGGAPHRFHSRGTVCRRHFGRRRKPSQNDAGKINLPAESTRIVAPSPGVPFCRATSEANKKHSVRRTICRRHFGRRRKPSQNDAGKINLPAEWRTSLHPRRGFPKTFSAWALFYFTSTSSYSLEPKPSAAAASTV